MSDNTLGRKRPPLSHWFIIAKARSDRFAADFTAPDFPSANRARRAARYLRSRRRRVLEFVVATGLLACLSPLFVLIALSVKRSSPGPVLFRQKRHGENLGAFELLKFRSMYCGGHPDPSVTQATRSDPRITQVGGVLRRTSLDELPQLWNVVRGEMSLIGPRPHAIEHDDYYKTIVPRYAERFRARPGITGLAQVSGARGATPQPEDMKKRIDLDIQYLETASLALDCKILFRTMKEIIGSDAAY